MSQGLPEGIHLGDKRRKRMKRLRLIVVVLVIVLVVIVAAIIVNYYSNVGFIKVKVWNANPVWGTLYSLRVDGEEKASGMIEAFSTKDHTLELWPSSRCQVYNVSVSGGLLGPAWELVDLCRGETEKITLYL